MKIEMKHILIVFLLSLLFFSCQKKEDVSTAATSFDKDTTYNNYEIEFVELGSVNCIPCKKMQPVMKSIEEKYKGLVKVTFYDVWKDDAPAKKFGIQLIPTQVFLDSRGNEIMRHEGFFPEDEIDKFLQSQNVIIPK